MLRFVNLTLSGITDGMIFATVALALVMIFRSTRVLNFAQGDMLMITTFIAWTVQNETRSYWLALGAALLAGAALGALTERVLIRPLERKPGLNALIVTLGMASLLSAIAGMIWGAQPRSYPPPFSVQGFSVAGSRLLLSPTDVFTIAMVAITMIALVLLFRRTTLGLRMRAAALAPEIARILGVRVGRMLTTGWALAGLIGSLAGVLTAPSLFLGPNQFDPVLVYSFTAAIIGGLDSPVGSVVGGLLLGCTVSYTSGYAGSEISPLGACAVLLAVLVVRPSGLFGTSTARTA
ncbi:branched-chain amino acid ABC transporter permease [Streptacidiphilus rugosus]|uniref:branched-chain amino acid ABC transporter permease n=1 Tax=Streptacidiphilus rugosus TaxID=405783 RepID=UPI00056C5AC5|nr:branched-chain amino acid ABC transporter permease [Streptacidiphilus rugosus]